MRHQRLLDVKNHVSIFGHQDEVSRYSVLPDRVCRRLHATMLQLPASAGLLVKSVKPNAKIDGSISRPGVDGFSKES